MKDFKLKGKTIDEKLKHAETVINRLNRRGHKVAVYGIPPSVLATFVEIPTLGIPLLSCALFRGKIVKAVVVVRDFVLAEGEEKPRDVFITFSVKKLDSVETMTVKLEGLYKVVDVKVDVEDGDVLEVIVVLVRFVGAGLAQHPDRRRRGVKDVDVEPLGNAPRAPGVRTGGSAFIHDRGGGQRQGAVDDIRVPRDPANVGHAPVDILGMNVLHIL